MSANTELEPLLVSVKDAARILCIGKTKLYELVGAGELKPVRLSAKKTLFAYAELRAFTATMLVQRDTQIPEAKRRRAVRQADTQPQQQATW